MKLRAAAQALSAENNLTTVPLTLEGWSILHQMFRVRRAVWNALGAAARAAAIEQAAAALAAMERREEGQSALFSVLGHKADLLLLHFRPSFEELNQAELVLAGLALSEVLEPISSYLSVVELGLYEFSVRLYGSLAERGIKPGGAEWKQAVESELLQQRAKMTGRLRPAIPATRYLCFYPMDKKRGEASNWYQLPIGERRRMMHEHGLVGRRFAGQVTQIISGSAGLDDWEWGVDLFADDPLVFKKLVYEMRFDEASAIYALFGPFYVGLRRAACELGELLSPSPPR